MHIGIGGGPIGVVRSVAGRMLALRHLHGRQGTRIRMANDRMAKEAAARASPRVDMTRSPDWIVRPVARVQIAAGAALAGWHAQRGTKGWWQHGDGGYGWVGPLFWPFAYYDVIDYTLWGDGMGFWGYGYRDIYAAIFTPYDEDELAGYMTPARHRRPGRVPSLAQICGDDFSEFARLPIEQIRAAIRSSEEQRAALDELANASSEAAQAVSAACPKRGRHDGSRAAGSDANAAGSDEGRDRPHAQSLREILGDAGRRSKGATQGRSPVSARPLPPRFPSRKAARRRTRCHGRPGRSRRGCI